MPMLDLEILIISCAPFARLSCCLKSVVGAQRRAGRADKIRVLLQGKMEPSPAAQFQTFFPAIDFVQTDLIRRPGGARNFLLKLSKAKAVHFIDEDVELPTEYYLDFQELRNQFPEVLAFGGPDLGFEAQNHFQKVASACMGSFFGTGPSRARYFQCKQRFASESHLTTASLILLNPDQQKLTFPENWVAGEESVFLEQAGALGPLLYVPQLFVYHHRRPTLGKFMAQFARYGQGRGHCIRRGKPWKWIHFLPFLGVTLLILFPFPTVILYLVLNAFAVLEILFRTRQLGFLHSIGCFLLFPFLHLSYFLGLTKGIVFKK